MPRLRSNLVVVYVVRRAAAGIEVLLLQRPAGHRFAGDWQTVGGHIEHREGETAWQAAIRELGEETGYQPERWMYADRPEQWYNPENDTIYFVPAFVALVDGATPPTLSDEHQAWRWVAPGEAAEIVTWRTMRESLALVEQALNHPDQSQPGLTTFEPDELRA